MKPRFLLPSCLLCPRARACARAPFEPPSIHTHSTCGRRAEVKPDWMASTLRMWDAQQETAARPLAPVARFATQWMELAARQQQQGLSRSASAGERPSDPCCTVHTVNGSQAGCKTHCKQTGFINYVVQPLINIFESLNDTERPPNSAAAHRQVTSDGQIVSSNF